MGREIRRVPPNWKHPLKEGEDAEYRSFRGHTYPNFQPKFEESFKEAASNWKKGFNEHKPSKENDFAEYWEFEGNPPDRDWFVDYNDEEPTWFQMYETVSEGTPVTPPFETQQELIDYLCTQGTYWVPTPWNRDSAEKFVSSGYAPSMAVHQSASGTKIITAENM